MKMKVPRIVWVILLFGLIRLYGITNPPIEVSHAWRQTTVTMVARNYYEVDPNILYPRIDISEDLTGITGMEFPLLNYLIFLVSKVFGYTHWYGRLINLIISSLGCWFFYRLLRKYFNENISFYTTFILVVSLWFCYSRKIMPDTFSMSLIIMGMYYGSNYLEGKSNKGWQLVGYALLVLMGLLSKLPSGYLLALFVLWLFSKTVPMRRKLVFCLTSLLVVIPVVWWYFYWVPYLVKEYGLWHFFMGKGILQGAKELLENWIDTLAHFYDNALKFIGFGVFLIGLVFCFVKKERLILTILGLSFAAFLLVMMKSGWTFSHHEYYVIPFVPVMALVAGFGVASISKPKLRTVLLLAIALENVLNQHSDFMIREDRKPILQLEEVFDSFSERTDLIAINSGQNPAPMYFTHRKGWVASNEQLSDAAFLADLQQRGCKYVLVLKRAYGTDLQLECPTVYDDENYRIYKLEMPLKASA